LIRLYVNLQTIHAFLFYSSAVCLVVYIFLYYVNHTRKEWVCQSI